MADNWRIIIERIHDSGGRVVLAITGGGSGAIGELLGVPGGSRTLVEAVVPYDQQALAQFLLRESAHACSEETAVAMANRARERARENAGSAAAVGIGATASLASDRPKKGDHRCHVAAATDGGVRVTTIVLEKGRHDRAGEEQLVARAILTSVAAACCVAAPSLTDLLGPNDRLTEHLIAATDAIDRLLAGHVARVTVLPDGQLVIGSTAPRGVLAGSFNPLHAAHVELARVAAEILAAPVAFELSVVNVDKPPLSSVEVRRRLCQFAWRHRVELTRAPTFLEKSRLFPGTTFVVGADTAERIIAPKYYANTEPAMLAALAEIAAHGCRFLVAGRADAAGQFLSLAELPIPAEFRSLFLEIPEGRFRSDFSSTQLRGD